MLDKAGKPRGGLARMNFANKVHGGGGEQHKGADSKEKAAPPIKEPAEPKSTAKHEEHGADMAMHAHSHKGGEHDVSEMPIHEVVKAHGPATHVMSEHDHEAGTHHVHSVHGEKHHHSDHESTEASAEHMGDAMGVKGEVESPDEDHLASPFEGEETPEEEKLESQVSGGSKKAKAMGMY